MYVAIKCEFTGDAKSAAAPLELIPGFRYYPVLHYFFFFTWDVCVFTKNFYHHYSGLIAAISEPEASGNSPILWRFIVWVASESIKCFPPVNFCVACVCRSLIRWCANTCHTVLVNGGANKTRDNVICTGGGGNVTPVTLICVYMSCLFRKLHLLV